ncbi:hypothetical protein [Caloranaerobacter azorensis]|uniref:Uncharacterized protein n=1 Tax=Caloranaerobacter azorensis TaxID=116090 RepID=A0A6P1YG04_9FIRM|nr:hypothetical protein [Caloranaerobacter azorensis]QIB26846.1 hypothetical protein G3A45_05770 [Caloranaerobacter azorensis]
MNIDILHKHIKRYKEKLDSNPQKYSDELLERNKRKIYYQSWTKEKLLEMSKEEFEEYLSKLWAMLIWGNKKYVIDKIILDNGFDRIKKQLAMLIWGKEDIETRWDKFRKTVKGFGPAMMSELLCQTHPDSFMIWNRKAYIGFRYLEINGLPRYDYQCNGKKYKQLCGIAKDICNELEKIGIKNVDLLTVDYFIWDELQVESNLNQLKKKNSSTDIVIDDIPKEDNKNFIHNEIRDKLADIGKWLGFNTETEVKVADGAIVDTIWEATIGNMGRVIYVFEVQTKGSIDSLLLNLLKSLNNPAVQGVVAVSDEKQLEKIQRQAQLIQGLAGKLKIWNYKEVLDNYEALQKVNESINKLGLVPQGF